MNTTRVGCTTLFMLTTGRQAGRCKKQGRQEQRSRRKHMPVNARSAKVKALHALGAPKDAPRGCRAWACAPAPCAWCRQWGYRPGCRRPRRWLHSPGSSAHRWPWQRAGWRRLDLGGGGWWARAAGPWLLSHVDRQRRRRLLRGPAGRWGPAQRLAAPGLRQPAEGAVRPGTKKKRAEESIQVLICI